MASATSAVTGARLNYQGPDRGTQYRSTTFPATQEQADIARAYIAQLNQAHTFYASVVTTIETGREFHPAEAYHQDFLTRHPTSRYRAEPVLVTALPKRRSSM